MKSFLSLITVFCLATGSLFSQNCVPDSLYQDSTAGVYPGPITPTNPNGGIDTFACIGQPFEFVFTVIIPDTFSFNGLLLTLRSAFIEPEGAISGLPEGIDYACNPPDCIFQADSIGCFILQGTPTTNNQPGEFEPVITMTINTNIFPITTSFPGTIFPGKYILELRDENCMLTNVHAFLAPEAWTSNPNPVTDIWRCSFRSESDHEHLLAIYDLSGRILRQRTWTGSGLQNMEVDLSDLASGMYLYRLNSGDRMISGRLMVKP